MPAIIAKPSKLTPNRSDRQPPYVPLKALRLAADLTLEDVAAKIKAAFPEMEVSRGTLSAIESGSRGVSDLMLRALERAYGLDEGMMTTDYIPRQRTQAEEVA